MSGNKDDFAAIHAFVGGRVQGVGFRYSTVHQAESLGLSGWVRNTQDGRVEVFAQGSRDRLGIFVSWLRKGPPFSHVSAFDCSFCVADPGIRGFRLRY